MGMFDLFKSKKNEEDENLKYLNDTKIDFKFFFDRSSKNVYIVVLHFPMNTVNKIMRSGNEIFIIVENPTTNELVYLKQELEDYDIKYFEQANTIHCTDAISFRKKGMDGRVTTISFKKNTSDFSIKTTSFKSTFGYDREITKSTFDKGLSIMIDRLITTTQKDIDVNALLHTASNTGNIELVKKYLNQGADVDTEFNKLTSLAVASAKGHT